MNVQVTGMFISYTDYRLSELGMSRAVSMQVVDFTAIIERKFPAVGKKFITWGVSNSMSIAIRQIE